MIKEEMAKVQTKLEEVMNGKEFKENLEKAIKSVDSSNYFNIRLYAIRVGEEVRFSIEILDSLSNLLVELPVANTSEKYWDLWPLIYTINENIEEYDDLYFDRIERIASLTTTMLPKGTVYDKAYVDQGSSVLFYVKYRGE